ncbi:protein DpdD [Saccharothrix obliqua]|uniref:protein DpdD n=1 Tax=Saccharothrix obliqua TaxID=2861747 RepID=UPI001C5EBAD7|nr:protein DpdD [Saccharothrix obliqua]MBW4717523.1 hypothetical protein [Saccharothrix obliqua]
MSGVDRAVAWDGFLTKFFSAPNGLRAGGSPAVERMIGYAGSAWLGEESVPFFLPFYVDGWWYWYAVCPDREQRLWVRDLIRAHVGSWISFDGQVIDSASTQAVDAVVNALVGTGGCAFRVRIARDAAANREVGNALERLSRTLAARPHRKARLVPPLGTLLGDFSDACASGARGRAEELLAQLEQDHRLSKANRLFLKVQFFAAFELWDELEQLEQLPDLIRLDRPVLASDALARLVMARLGEQADIAEFSRATAGFGCLISSVTAIRSTAGAQYYAYWSLASGEPAGDVAARLESAGWLAHAQAREVLAALLAVVAAPSIEVPTPVDLSTLRDVVAQRRYDVAIELLEAVPPSGELLDVVIDLLVATFHPDAISIFQRWKAVLGGDSADGRLTDRLSGQVRGVDLASVRFGDAVAQAFAILSAAERSRALEELREQAVPRLMRAGALVDAMQAIQEVGGTLQGDQLAELVDLLLDLERDLFHAAGDVPGIRQLRMVAVEIWALGDQTGDRRRAARLLDLVGRALDNGLNPVQYRELVENLNAGWGPFLTDADVALGLEAIEVLAASRPDGEAVLDSFATLILSRIGTHNAHRIEPASLETAVLLSGEFGLHLTGLPDHTVTAVDQDAGSAFPPGGSVAIYSLMEPAARRAATILARRHPGLRVETLAAKVATEALRTAARNADLLVIADKAAAHAATDALKAARGDKPTEYARGKGTASLVQAVADGLVKWF